MCRIRRRRVLRATGPASFPAGRIFNSSAAATAGPLKLVAQDSNLRVNPRHLTDNKPTWHCPYFALTSGGLPRLRFDKLLDRFR